MTERCRLPNKRNCESFQFEHNNIKYHASIGRFEDGSIAEIFLDAGITGTAINIMAMDAATTFSIARQYGAPLNVIMDALCKLADGTPAGPLGAALRAALDQSS